MSNLSTTPPIRVLVVEDSPSQRAFLLGLLQSAPDLVVVGTASTGTAAIAEAQRLRPQLIAMDIQLPDLNGYEVTRRIMQLCPTRIVLISSDDAAAQRSQEAIAVGALTVMRKLPGIDSARHQDERKNFLTTLRLMAGVPVVTRHAPRPSPASSDSRAASRPQIVAMAASTGGPLALQTILSNLDAHFPAPILIVQHITVGFASALVEWLASTVPLQVQLATPGLVLRPGQVYIAPDDRHMLVQPGGVLALRPASRDDRFCPSADVLFTSVAAVYHQRALGVVLTGMGDDGTRGSQALVAAGSTTLAQDEASCVVYGMPRAAAAAGAITRVVALDDLATTLRRLLGSYATTHP